MVARRGKEKVEETTALNLRGIPVDTYYRLKMAAAAEHKSVKDLLLELIEGKIQELERKGMLPKGKMGVS
ncbi:MAG: hypothetical protein H6750_10225 [Nitrospiraceae bacterium]|nr:hypothetical protein [Nitrospira sp.]MCA9456918.1 hypothetical protein [Nitrospira sp.]MCB9774685.1 hypothetical protein [Nitrospiraceae bacterium]HQU27618.1 hypothetical protein [Nitrospirales bacterium]